MHHWIAPGLDIELLASSRGPPASVRPLPALRAHGLALRMLDFLIRDAVPAIILHGAGVLVNVPDPARYAIHKLTVSSRRASVSLQAGKDAAQAEALLRVLHEDRPLDVAAAAEEAVGRGPSWRKALAGGAGRIVDADLRAWVEGLLPAPQGAPDLQEFSLCVGQTRSGAESP